VGDLPEMRMLILNPCKRNIRRIGSLQSPNRAPVGEVVGVAVVVGDGLLRSGGDGQEALDSSGSSKHHKLGVFVMAEPMMFSPSSFPHTSNKVLGVKNRNTERYEPLKIIASLGTQTFPKARFPLAVSRNSRPVRPGLSVRTLIFSC
jgi:hypothetical protein